MCIHLDQEIPSFTTFWRFKEALADLALDQQVFEQVTSQLVDLGLLVKKGTLMDAAIIESSNRPLSHKRRQELAEDPSSQIDTDVYSNKKRGVLQYFGYKCYIGVDIETKLIRKVMFTPAKKHDSTQTKELVSYDEKSLFGDKGYSNGHHNYSVRHYGWYYGVLGKAPRGGTLSGKQKKRNRKYFSVQATVEHPFA